MAEEKQKFKCLYPGCEEEYKSKIGMEIHYRAHFMTPEQKAEKSKKQSISLRKTIAKKKREGCTFRKGIKQGNFKDRYTEEEIKDILKRRRDNLKKTNIKKYAKKYEYGTPGQRVCACGCGTIRQPGKNGDITDVKFEVGHNPKSHSLVYNEKKIKETRKKQQETYIKQHGEKWRKVFDVGLSVTQYKNGYDKLWSKDLREKIKKKDNYTCQLCNKEVKKGLIVHHIDYDKKNSVEENLICLCRKCHTKVHIYKIKRIADDITLLSGWIVYLNDIVKQKYLERGKVNEKI